MPGSRPTTQAKTKSAEPEAMAGLPPADTDRWVAKRKAQVVTAVQAGLLTLDEALSRYKLTLEEFTGWQRALYRHGLRGLQVTRSQLWRLADRGKGTGRGAGKRRLGWSGRHV